MSEIFPGYVNYPPSFMTCLPYLLASAIYHSSWLSENLCKNHPLFLSRFWRSDVRTRLIDQIVVGRGYCPHVKMHATGVPVQLSLVNKVCALETLLQECHETIHGRVHDNLVAGVRAEDLRELFREQNCKLEETLSDFKEGMRVSLANSGEASGRTEGVSTRPRATAETHAWGGRLHPVPHNFTFPLCNTKRLCDLWFFGDEARFPFGKLLPLDMPGKTDQVNLARARRVMKYLTDVAIEASIVNSVDVLSSMSYEMCDEVFSKLESSLGLKVGKKRKISDLQYGTFYNSISK